MRRALLACIVVTACNDDPSTPVVAPAPVVVGSPAAPQDHALGKTGDPSSIDGPLEVFDRMHRATTADSAEILAPFIAPDYTEAVCGKLRHFDSPSAAARVFMNRYARGLEITMARDGLSAWGVASMNELFLVENRADGWKLVAGAVTLGCSEAPAVEVPGTPIEITDRTGGDLSICATWRIDRAHRWSADRVFAVDANAANGPDIVELDLANAHVLGGGTMAWLATSSAVSQFKTFAIAERRMGGWTIVAAQWTAPMDRWEATCPTTTDQGGYVNTAWEAKDKARAEREKREIADEAESMMITGYIKFAPNDATLAGEEIAIVEEIVGRMSTRPKSTIQLNGYAVDGETEPFALSERRALVVNEYLRDHGIAIARQYVDFYGVSSKDKHMQFLDGADQAAVTFRAVGVAR